MKNYSEKELKLCTKDELVFYLMKIQPHIPNYVESIKDVILWKRNEEINARIAQILDESVILRQKYNDTLNPKLLVQLQTLNKELEKLWKKEKKIQKELLGV
jgi:hypothetical protein